MPIFACLLWAASPLWGQIGNTVGYGHGDPGQMRGIGSSSLDNFRSYSAGTPGTSGGGQGGNLLSVPLSAGGYSGLPRGGDSSSILDQNAGPSFTSRSLGAAPGVMVVGADTPRGQSRNYMQSNNYARYTPPAANDMALSSAATRQELITSLVPRSPGIYGDAIKDGEDRFREGRYLLAFGRFEAASFVGQDDTESLLSMSHAQFAMGSYATASYYLRRAIVKLPNLAQMKLSPKGFYGSASDYVQELVDLEDYTQREPRDANGWLLLAYYSWFDDPNGPAKAKLALGKALAAGSDIKIVEAVEIFYDGMLASGKVTGKLVAAPRPQTRPAPAGQ